MTTDKASDREHKAKLLHMAKLKLNAMCDFDTMNLCSSGQFFFYAGILCSECECKNAKAIDDCSVRI